MNPTDLDQQTFALLVRGALFSIAALLIGLALTKTCSAQAMSRYWRGVAVALIALPFIALYLPVLPLWEAQNPQPHADITPGIPANGTEWRVSYPDSPEAANADLATAIPVVETASETSAKSWFTALWMVGAGLVIARWLVATLSAWRLTRTGIAPDTEVWETAILALGEEAKGVRVLLSPKTRLPMVAGCFRPVLLLPSEAETWDAATRDAVLAHELAHVQRRDPLFLMLSQIAVSLHWINPLAWVAARRSRLADERTADDAVLAAGTKPERYATLLVDFAKRATAPTLGVPIAAPSMAHRSTVGHRVERLLDSSQRRGTPRAWRSVGMVMATLSIAFVAGSLTTREASAEEEPAAPEAGEDHAVLPEVIEAKLKKIVIPAMAFEEATIEDAVEFLRLNAAQHDPEPDPKKKGVNIIIRNAPDAGPDPTITLNLQNIPLGDALRFTVELAGYDLQIEPFGIVIGKDLPSPLITRTFRVPGDFIGLLQPAPDPKDDDPFGAPAARENSIVKLLQNHGITLGDEGSVTYISPTSELVVRGTQETMDLIEVLLADLNDKLPSVLRLRVELYEVPKADALKVITETDSKPSADGAMKIVRGLVEAGDARLLASPSLITRSGQRAKIEAGESIEYVASYKAVDGKDAPVIKKVLAGTSVEVEPTVGADGQTIDVNIAISMARGKPTFHKRKIVAPASGLEREVESVSIAAQTLSLAFTTITGQTQLVGNLQSDVVDNPNAVLAFVTATITRATR